MPPLLKPVGLARIGLSLAAVGAVCLVPLPGIPKSDAGTARLFSAVAITFIVALAAVLGKAWSRTRSTKWLSAAAVAFLLGVFAYASHQRTLKVCTAPYAGNTVLIGRHFTPVGEGNARSNPTATPQDMLFDAAGRADLVWTADSIATCRSQLLSAGASWLPLLAASLAALLQAGLCWKPGLAAPRSAGVPKSEPHAPDVRYDAFVSYRHGGAAVRPGPGARVGGAGLPYCHRRERFPR